MIVQDHTYTSFPKARILAAMKGRVEDDLSFTRDNLIMRRSKDSGEYYLMCMFTNRYRDRDVHSAPHKGGEIISGAAHAKYMSLLDKNPEMAPQLWSLHIPGTERKNRAHWWDYDGHFCYAEFLLTAEEAAGIAAFVKEYEPGLSHGFFVLQYDEKEAVIEEYFTYEISILPIEWAANQWTTFEMIRKELQQMKLTPERRAILVKLHGEDLAKMIETKGDSMLKLLTEFGVEMKYFKPEDGSETAQPAAENKADKPTQLTQEKTAAEVTENSPVTQAEVVAAMETLHKAVGADITELSKNIEKLYEVVKELSADVYERLAEIGANDNERLAAKAAAAPISIIANWMPKSVIGTDEAKVPANSKLLGGPAQSGTDLTTQEAMNIFSGFAAALATEANRGN